MCAATSTIYGLTVPKHGEGKTSKRGPQPTPTRWTPNPKGDAWLAGPGPWLAGPAGPAPPRCPHNLRKLHWPKVDLSHNLNDFSLT